MLCLKQVYPRTGGGNRRPARRRVSSPGLSPHGRGKPHRQAQLRPGPGSIPARAGETSYSTEDALYHRVYPRTGGGNRVAPPSSDARKGLSPHGRGKPRGSRLGCPSPGSIPARAGETDFGKMLKGVTGVYPRTGGGNSTTKSHQCCHMGTILTRSGVTKVLIEAIFALREALHRRPRSPLEVLQEFRCGDYPQLVHRARP